MRLSIKILHINVRLSDGGAALVMLDLHNRLLSSGMGSKILYGYGKKGLPDPLEKQVNGVVSIGQAPITILNFAWSSLFGMEVFKPTGAAIGKISREIEAADLVHLHVIHSYFLPPVWFLELLADSKKPIVWTLHDFWVITGRCASIEGCDQWISGCGNCPNPRSYPPTIIDFSADQHRRKREAIALLSTQLTMVSPTRFVATTVQTAFPEANVRCISNGVDRSFEMACFNSTETKCAPREDFRVVVVASDLSDRTKIDRHLIEKVLELSGVELVTVGAHSPFQSSNVDNRGVIKDRGDYLSILRQCDCMIFSSKKDTFGLVMIEALYAGVPVLALESDAASEVLGKVDVETCRDVQEVVDACRSRLTQGPYAAIDLSVLVASCEREFSGETMTSRYRDLYLEVANKGS